MNKFLITGGAGVIGLELVPKLLDRGYSVWVGDMKPRPQTFDNRVHYRQGNLNTLTLAEVNAFAPDVIIHLAATFERSTETPGFWSENFQHNVTLSHHIMSIARELNHLQRVVFASSYLIYQPELYQFETVPPEPRSLTESDPVLPRNLTGMAKLAHEIELRFLADQEGIPFSSACARIFRGYGRNSRDVISRWVRSLLAGEAIEVYNANGVFDYLYARDSAEGLIRLAIATDVTGIVNLGTGRARSVAEVVQILRGHFPDMQCTDHGNAGPIELSQADISLWKKHINWVPQYDLETAIPEIIDHERAQRHNTSHSINTDRSVLVTSASAKAPLINAVKAALLKQGAQEPLCWAADVDAGALAKHVADGFWQLPPLDQLTLDKFVQGCKERQIGVVIPTRDGELEFWAEHYAHLSAQGITVVVSPKESIQRCLDKLAFSQFGHAHDLPFIPAAESPDGLGGPRADSSRYTVKERFGAGSLSIGLNLSHQEALEHASNLNAPIYQPFVAGQELSVDAWVNSSGQPKGLIMRWRERITRGESQVTTTFSEPELEQTFLEVIRKLDLRGPIVLQAIVDEHGQPHVIECNSRFGGASTLSIAAGLDSFYWSLLEAENVDTDTLPFLRTAGELRQIRLPRDEIVHDSCF